MMQERQNYGSEANIYLLDVIKELWRRKILIIAAGVICMISAVLISKYLLTEIYESATKVFIIVKDDVMDETGTVTAGNLTSGSELTNDFQEIVKGRLVLETVIRKLELEMDSPELSRMIRVRIPKNTRILEIIVTNKDPYLARDLADEIREAAISAISEIISVVSVNSYEPASLPIRPSGPNTVKNGVIGAFLGSGAAVFVIVLIYLLDMTIKTAEEVEWYFNTSVLGTIPSANKRRKRRQQIAQAYENLTMNVQYYSKNKKIIEVIGCSPDREGVLASYNMAVELTGEGNKVLFIDADLKNTRVAKTADTAKGLSDYLSEQSTSEEIVRKQSPQLDVISSGYEPSRLSKLVGDRRFALLIGELSPVYDYIIIDVPSLSYYVNIELAAKVSDGIILVVEKGTIAYKKVSKMNNQISQIGLPIIGAVLNNVE